MSNHTTRTALPPPHLRWWHCDHEGPGLEGCPVCRPVADKGMSMWTAGLLRALDREHLALVGQLAAERDTLRAEVTQLRDDRAVLAPVVAFQLGDSFRYVMPDDPLPLLTSMRAQSAHLLGSDDVVDASAYLRSMFARMAAEAAAAAPAGGEK